MKKRLAYFFTIAFFLFSCTSTKKSESVKLGYEIVKDSVDKILIGKISRSVIENDTAFGWFKENMKWGTANSKAVEIIQQNKNDLSFVVFAGTWCHDTQNILPVFYRMLDKAEFSNNKIILYGTDRNKITLNNLSERYKVTNVPTFIVYLKNKEIGRVVEYGKYGDVEKEIAEIISSEK